MGVVRKQSTLTTLTSFLGGVIGFINQTFLFAKLMDPDEFGLARVLVTIGVMYAQLSLLGFQNVILRFFPFFENKEKGHYGFLSFGILFILAGFILTTSLFLLFQPQVISVYGEKSQLLVTYYRLGMLFGFSYLVYIFFSNYLRSLYDWFIPRFINEVGLRLLVTVGISLYALNVLDFHTFIWVYAGMHAVMALGVIIYTAARRQLMLPSIRNLQIQQYLKPMLSQAFFASIGGISIHLVLAIDTLMLASLGLTPVAVYSLMVNFAALMLFPFRSLVNLSSPRVAEYWKEQDIPAIGRIYKRVSLLGYISGVWLFFVIWLNLDYVYSLIGKEAYMSGKLVFVFIGLASLFDIISGLNTTILVTSKAFKYDLLFNLLLLIISILTNYYFIFILDEGVNGAAIATMISILLYNVSRVIFVYKLANIHPFTMGLLKVTVLAVGIWLGVSYMPDSSYPLLDIVWKSSLFTVFFGLTILGFRIAPDLNEFLEVILSRLTRWKSQIF